MDFTWISDFLERLAHFLGLACLLILLVIGDIERNPSPVLRSQAAIANNSKVKLKACISIMPLFCLYIYIYSPPTYKQMIELLDEARREQVKSGGYLGDLLSELFRKKFPNIQISTRPICFLQAIKCIEAPLSSSHQKLDKPTRNKYLEKFWKPKVNNK